MRAPTIALAQINTTVGDLGGNVKRICDSISRAERSRADFVIFPELATTGYPPKDLLLKPRFLAENRAALDTIAATVGETCAVVGFVDQQDVVCYNAAAVLHRGAVVGTYRKRMLPNYDVFDEKRYFAEGRENAVFTVNGHTFGIVICEDVFTRNTIITKQKKAGASFVIALSASPFYAGKVAVRDALISAKARRSALPLYYVNLVGGQDDLVFDGNSTVFDASGTVIARAQHCAEELLIADPTMQGLPPAPRSDVADVHDALVLGLRDYVEKNGFTTVTLGLSGGIDSALVAALAAEAIGPDKVTAVAMPSAVSSTASVADARTLAGALGITLKELSIAPVVDEYHALLADEFLGTAPNIAEENIQARIRGNILMALSNKFGHLVLSTGNKSELAMGYSTLYGDMAGGFAVISDVPKTLVYALAHYINRNGAIIPQSIIDKEPSAELRPDQKDSDTLPPYVILDGILDQYVEENKSADEIIAAGFDRQTVCDVIRRVDQNEYKRSQAPVGIKITSKAFGFGRRMPITNKYGL